MDNDQRIARRRPLPPEHVTVTVMSRRLLRSASRGEPTEMRMIDSSIYGASLAADASVTVRPGDTLLIEHGDLQCEAVVRNTSVHEKNEVRIGVEVDVDAKPLFDAIRAAAAEVA